MDKSTAKSVGIFSNTFWSIYNFRRSLVKRLLAEGYSVFAISADDQYQQKVADLGCETVVIKNFDAQSTAVLKEAAIIREIVFTLKNLPCEYIYTFTIKPNLYSALTTALTGKKIIITVNGLGNVFSSQNFISKVSLQLFRRAFRQAFRVVFQNVEDYSFFRDRIGLTSEKVSFVRGSGVNTTEFAFSQKSLVAGENLTFLLACRLLKEKGIYQYIAAAKQIKELYPHAQFWLLGMEAKNPSSIKKEDLQPHVDDGTINMLSKTDDVNSLLERTDVLVLPSFYNEGVPRILLEGLSKGLPIITTDSVGCRETVKDGINGYLTKPKSVEQLRDAIQRIIELPLSERAAMCLQSRRLAETEFDEKVVVDSYINLLKNKEQPSASTIFLQPAAVR